MPRIDRTILSLIALTIAAGGAFTILTKYNVPQLNYTLRRSTDAQLEAEADLARPRPALMPRVGERDSVRIARMIQSRSFESLDDLNAENPSRR
jgi:hypothetical protein